MREKAAAAAAAAAEILICGINYARVFPTNHESMSRCGTFKKKKKLKKRKKCKVRVRPLSRALVVLRNNKKKSPWRLLTHR